MLTFTKHLPARDKVTQLVRLLGCRFEQGRPDAAPAMRRERLTQTTLAQAMGEKAVKCKDAFDGVYDEDVEYIMACVADAHGARPGLLPHQHDGDDLERRFPVMPTIEGPDDCELPDYEGNHHRGHDAVEKNGEAIAEEVIAEARNEGRKRKVFS